MTYCCDNFRLAADCQDFVLDDDFGGSGTWKIHSQSTYTGVRFCPFCGSSVGKPSAAQMTDDEVEAAIVQIMREHGPDGHIDGYEQLTAFVLERIRGIRSASEVALRVRRAARQGRG